MAMQVSSSTNKLTPPGSIINAPPTPPPTDTKVSARVVRILRVFQGCQTGNTKNPPWMLYRLSSDEHGELLDQLRLDDSLAGFVNDKIRYDYNPIRGELVLRMPSILHDTFISKLVKEIEKSLERLADTESQTRPFIKGIEPANGSLSFQISDDENTPQLVRHEPDIRFKHKDAAWPGVVIEIAHSQKKKSLVGLADNYILGSYGGIRIVVGLDLDYKKSKEASISIWRLKNSTNDDGEVEGEVEQVVENQLFRDAVGNHLHSSASSLRLSLKDFSIDEITRDIPDSEIIIDSKTLCSLLEEAENSEKRTTAMEGAKPRPFKRKWRADTPPEQLTYSDEEEIKKQERRIQRKSEKLDESYGEDSIAAENSSQNSF